MKKTYHSVLVMMIAIILLEATFLFSPLYLGDPVEVQPIGWNAWLAGAYTSSSTYVVDFDPGFRTDPYPVNPFQIHRTLTQDNINLSVQLAIYQPEINSSYKAALIIQCDSTLDPVLSLQLNVSGSGQLLQVIGTQGGYIPEWIGLEFDSKDHNGFNSSTFHYECFVGFRGFAGAITVSNSSDELVLNAQGFPYVMTNWGHRIVVVFALGDQAPTTCSFLISLTTQTVFRQSHLLLNVTEEVSL